MKLTEIVERVRDVVRDPNAHTWDDAFIIRQINLVQYDLFIRQAQADTSYFNAELELLGSEAVQKAQGAWEWHLPRWAYSVVQVREAHDSSASWSAPIKRRRAFSEVQGWDFTARSRITLTGFSDAPDLEVWVAKIPAPLRVGSATTVHPEPNGLYLTTSESIYDVELEEGSYINSVFEIKSAGLSGASLTGGQVRVARSSALYNDGGSPRIDARMSADWSVALTTADEWEMHAEVADPHIRYLIMMAAEACFQNTANVNGLNAIGRTLGALRANFIEGIQPRDNGEPGQWTASDDDYYLEDPDRDPMTL